MLENHWEKHFAQRSKNIQSSAIRELLKLSEKPDIISFGGGFPAPEVFPIERFKQASQKVLNEQGNTALQYSTTEGYPPLRELIAEFTNKDGLKISKDNVLITSGSQQALDLIGKLFIDPKDKIVVENPTYLGALQAWAIYGADYTTVHMDNEGMIIEDLQKAIQTNPKLIYALPNFQNPTGVSLSIERRNKLIELAANAGVPIIEDDPYGKLIFEGEPIPSLLSIDSQHRNSEDISTGNVIYLSTFSKLLAPGMRLAWVIAPTDIIRKLVLVKQGTDLNTSTINQMVTYEVARDGFLENHIKLIQDTYRNRRNVMLAALKKEMPEGIEWTHPTGGLFLWVKLPKQISAVDLFNTAIEYKIAYVPGNSFFAKERENNTMRLNFSYASPENIEEGIARLAKALKSFVNT